jgi:glycosyltransferase involved in cell wall biosynthesis
VNAEQPAAACYVVGVARRPRFVESSDKPRALLAGFAEVPGPTASGVRGEQLLLAFSEDVEFDALTLKGASMTHIQRVGAARMMRVPVPDAGVGPDGAKAAFRERLATFRRALTRQLDAERYDVVLCLDLVAAAAAVPSLRGAKLVIDVADVPSSTFAARWPVFVNDESLRQEWEAAEAGALRAARLLTVPSRLAGRALSARADPRLLRAAPRLVDTRRFAPPSMELSIDETRTIVVHGGREARRCATTADLLQRLARRCPGARIVFTGHPGRADAAVVDALARRNLGERVALVDIPTPVEAVQALQSADVVVVPAGGEGDAWGVPHRVLEALACERAVVVGGTEAAYKDAIHDGIHARVVGGDADEVACVVRDLLADDATRRALAREGRRQALRFDLVGRLPEMAQLLTEATGVAFVASVPPLDEPAPASAPTPVAPGRPLTNVVIAVPPAVVSPDYSAGGAPTPAQRAPPRSGSAPAANPLPATAAEPSSSAVATPAPPPPSRSLPVALHARRVALASLDEDDGRDGAAPDAWSGETMLDDGRGAALADAERVKAALLLTDAGDSEGPSSSAPSTAEGAAARARSPRSQLPRSMSLVIDAVDGADDWSRDTIADASPIEPSAPLPTHDRRGASALADVPALEPASEPTAEDDDGR